MKLLILGGNGMAGHVLVHYFRQRQDWEVLYTSRDGRDSHALYLDAGDDGQVTALLDRLRPDVVINAIGILNRDAEEHERLAYQVNGLLPHLLRQKLGEWGGKLVHISTDCVFSGERGDYTEFDLPDGSSVYAVSKAMGEVRHPPHLTVRTSIVGPEIRSSRIGLFDWFMSRQGVVKGYTEVYWNGVTTLQLAKSVERMLAAGISGLVHLTAPQKVSKYELLCLFKEIFGKTDAVIVPDGHFRQDRTLRCTREDAALAVPEYRIMLAELRDWMESDPSRYI
ncbi:SDR family oxidoreductase [Paenibacillus sp. YN15]|uniref:SDR family oxidoreductase n=1 Tax=Paenibacillus sp. YN15 TaxID=1742774 RepID=UPI000DCDEB2A|nr:SDR family oxidoreductase [Paenibacillus sp. YN15]RAV01242.1 SDR family NAD(P)-dependent oxidoreductase [Paenibacillus sp. YN15]